MSNQSPSKPVAAEIKLTDAKANSFANKVLRWELLETKPEVQTAWRPPSSPPSPPLTQPALQLSGCYVRRSARPTPGPSPH